MIRLLLFALLLLPLSADAQIIYKSTPGGGGGGLTHPQVMSRVSVGF